LPPGTGDNFQGGGGGNFNDQSPGNQNSGNVEGAPNVGPSNQPGMAVPDFLPPAQRVLFMRLQQKQQEDEERAKRLAEGGGTERENEGTTAQLHFLRWQYSVQSYDIFSLETTCISFIQECSFFYQNTFQESILIIVTLLSYK